MRSFAQKKTEGARDSLYSIGLLPSSHSVVQASAKTRYIARSSASFRFQRSKRELQNTATTSPLRFSLLPSHVAIDRWFPRRSYQIRKFKKVDKAPVGATSFFAETTDGSPQILYVNLVLRKQSNKTFSMLYIFRIGSCCYYSLRRRGGGCLLYTSPSPRD